MNEENKIPLPDDEVTILQRRQEIEPYLLDATQNYPEPYYLLEYNGVPFSTLGGIQALSGQKKNGKTFLLAQLMAADSLLVGRNEVHRNEPLDKRQLCVLKDGSDKTGKVLSTVLAAESPILAGGTVMFTAVWAYNVAVSQT